MDGCVAVWNTAIQNEEELLERGYFLKRPAQKNLVQAVKNIGRQIGYKNVYILSAFLPAAPSARLEKRLWLACHGLGRIPKKNVLFVPCGADKTSVIREMGSECFLLDDHTPNLKSWEAAGGTPIKCLNGINHRGGTRHRLMINVAGNTSGNIARDLFRILGEPLPKSGIRADSQPFKTRLRIIKGLVTGHCHKGPFMDPFVGKMRYTAFGGVRLF